MAIEVSAILKGVRLSPQKARLVADMVRGKKVDNALNILNFCPKKGARPFRLCFMEYDQRGHFGTGRGPCPVFLGKRGKG